MRTLGGKGLFLPPASPMDFSATSRSSRRLMLRMLVFSSLTGRAFLKDLVPLRLSGFWRLRGLESRGTCSWREGCTSWAGRLVAMIVVVAVRYLCCDVL